MAEVRPFRAIRYDATRWDGDLSKVIAPPYDVLNQADKDRLCAGSDRNIAVIDLPHIPPKSLGPPQAYERSAQALEAWLADGTLIREDRPGFYVYHQVFDHGGRTYTRRKFMAAVRLVPFEEGVVLPHEETFGGPKEDRLALTVACRANISPVFGLYTDPDDTIGQAFSAVAARPPDVVARMEGVENRVWIVTDGKSVDAVTEFMADKRLFIADGHHRYGTALNYQKQQEDRRGPLAADDPANYVMMVLGSMNDPGSLILPYNRVLVGADASVDKLVTAWGRACAVADDGDADLTLFSGADGSARALGFSDRGRLDELEPTRSPAWRSLDVAYLHRYLLDELSRGLDLTVRYVKSVDAAKALARQENGVALLMRATKMGQLRAVSEHGELMPQKSTYFYPKLATGLAIHSLA